MSAYSDVVIADGPVAYWRLNETSGTVANDEIGSLDGTISGTPTLNATGAVQGGGGAITFDGSNDYVDLGTPAALKPAQFSIECWVKYTTNFVRTIFCSRSNGYKLSISGGRIIGGFTNSSGTFRSVQSRGIYIDNQWHHVVLTYNLATLLLYVDGIVVASLTNSDAIDYTSTTGVAIGREGSSSSAYFIGGIDEVAFYNFALSSTQIDSHHALAALRPGWMFTYPPPLPREGSGVVMMNDDLWVIGGIQVNFNTAESYVYDPVTRTWTQKATAPVTFSYGVAMEHDDKIYVVAAAQARLMEYDPVTNTWVLKTDPSDAYSRVAACIHDGMLYYIDAVGSTHKVLRYNFTTDSWTDVTPAGSLSSVYYFNALSYGDLIYLVGPNTLDSAQKLYAYDPALATYSALANAPNASGRDPGWVEWNGIFWMLGGLNGFYTNDVFLYDPDTNTWDTGTDMANATATFTRATLFNGLLYALRGSSFNPSAELQRYQEPPIEGEVDIEVEFALFNYAYNQGALEVEFGLAVSDVDVTYTGILSPGAIRTGS